ncbi:hypothetical protein QYZ45_21355 [Vibrio parahaemolyticus]|nr:hypothetical protein [Vibrio parahaemolyticus]
MLNNLLTAYYGEIYGIAFFSHYFNNYKQAEQSALWQALVEVETLTAEKLKPILQAHGMEIENRHQEMMEKVFPMPKSGSIYLGQSWLPRYSVGLSRTK